MNGMETSSSISNQWTDRLTGVAAGDAYTSKNGCKALLRLSISEAPHCVEGGPFGVAFNPRDARVELLKSVTHAVGANSSPTDDQPSARQEGEAGTSSWLGQIRDGAAWIGRKQFNT